MALCTWRALSHGAASEAWSAPVRLWFSMDGGRCATPLGLNEVALGPDLYSLIVLLVTDESMHCRARVYV